MTLQPFAPQPVTPGGPAGGSLSGTYPNPALSSALAAPGTLSVNGAALGGATMAVNGAVQVAGGVSVSSGNVDVQTAGAGLRVAEGANAKQGTFVLSGAATTTVANTSVTANSRILLTTQALGTVAAASTLAVSSRVAGTSFTVTPSQATDTSTIAYEIFEPG